MRLALLLCAALAARAQVVGRLLYVTGPGRGVRMDILDGGHRAFVTLAPLTGQAGTVRDFVLTHTGPEQLVAPGATLLNEQAPPEWKVQAKGGRRLLRNPEATFWAYTPGLVIPVRFTVGKDAWRLQHADLPPRMFVSAGGR